MDDIQLDVATSSLESLSCTEDEGELHFPESCPLPSLPCVALD